MAELLKALVSTGWRRLAIVLLVVWETYWFYQWRSNYAVASDLAEQAYYNPISHIAGPDFDAASAAADHAFTILIVSPFVALAAFLAAKWIARGFRQSATKK